MQRFHIRPAIFVVVALVTGLSAGLAIAPRSAAAAFRPLVSPQALFPHGLVATIRRTRAKGRYRFRTWREPELLVSRGRIRLAMSWNGLDDDTWPYTRILRRILRRSCGIRDARYAGRIIAATYRARSLIKPQSLGGNAGVRMLRRKRFLRAGCHITVQAKGARWHTLSTTITPAR